MLRADRSIWGRAVVVLDGSPIEVEVTRFLSCMKAPGRPNDLRDITERKQMEKRCTKVRTLRTVIANVPIVLFALTAWVLHAG